MPFRARMLKWTMFAVVFASVAVVLVAGLPDTQDQTLASNGIGRPNGAIATKPRQNVDATQIASPSDADLHLPELFATPKGNQSHPVFQVETVNLAAPATSASADHLPETLTVDIDLENDRSY